MPKSIMPKLAVKFVEEDTINEVDNGLGSHSSNLMQFHIAQNLKLPNNLLLFVIFVYSWNCLASVLIETILIRDQVRKDKKSDKIVSKWADFANAHCFFSILYHSRRQLKPKLEINRLNSKLKIQ